MIYKNIIENMSLEKYGFHLSFSVDKGIHFGISRSCAPNCIVEL